MVGLKAWGQVAVDPCFTNTPKSSVAINISTATTTQLVAGIVGQKVYICGFTISMVSTVAANTLQLVYGTGASCTSPTNLTGVMSSGILANGAVVINYPTPLIPSAAGQSACAISTVGTGPSIAGVLSFIQQ